MKSDRIMEMKFWADDKYIPANILTKSLDFLIKIRIILIFFLRSEMLVPQEFHAESWKNIFSFLHKWTEDRLEL